MAKSWIKAKPGTLWACFLIILPVVSNSKIVKVVDSPGLMEKFTKQGLLSSNSQLGSKRG